MDLSPLLRLSISRVVPATFAAATAATAAPVATAVPVSCTTVLSAGHPFSHRYPSYAKPGLDISKK
jgi:hypothetical protein